MKSKFSAIFALALTAMLLAVPFVGGGESDAADPVTPVEVSTAQEFIDEISKVPTSVGTVSIVLKNDIDMSGVAYPEITSGQHGGSNLIIDGMYHKIIGLNKPIVTFCNGWTMSFSNLTISDMSVNNTETDWLKSGAGAFIGTIDSGKITLTNCHVIDSEITTSEYAGGLYGYFSAFYDNDYLKIIGCSVQNCEITGEHAGGIAGFGNGAGKGSISFADCSVSDCTIEATSTDYDTGGNAFGTFGSGPSVTFTNASFSNNTVTNPNGDRSDVLAWMNAAKTVSFDNQTYTLSTSPFTFEEVGFIQGADGGYYSNPSIVPQSYTISFDVLSSSENIIAIAGQPVVLPALPAMDGYNAVGWAYNGTLVGYMFTVTDSDVELVAYYEEIPTDDGSSGIPMLPSAPSQTVIEEASLGTDDIVVIAMCVLALLVLGFLFFIIKTS